MKRIGVVDIGANSLKLMLSEIEDSGYFKIIDEIKETVRLGSDLIDSNTLSHERISHTIEALKSFKSLCTFQGASEIIIVMSEDLKIAENKVALKNKIKEELGIEPKVLSFKEEIYYNFLSIKNTLYPKTSLMVDIGGSSTHLAVIQGENLVKSETIPIGCVNLSKLFSLQDLITAENSEKTNQYVHEILQNVSWLKEYNFTNVIALGGTLRNLCKVDRRRKRYPLDLTHNYSLTSYDICELYNLMKCKNFKQRAKLDGLSRDRADVIVGGTAIINNILKTTGILDLTFCGRGLREGVLYEYLNSNYESSREDILDFSIHGIMETLNMNINHADNVYNITKKLFHELKPLHKLGDEFNNVIKTSAYLHDCGISIRYYDHHLHSLYIILNSHFNGLTHKEILISAFSAAYHRNNGFEVPLARYSTILNKLDVYSIEKIGVILRIAEGLDRSLKGSITDLDVCISNDTVKIILYSPNDLTLEIHQALRAKCKFLDIYNKHLVIEKGFQKEN